MFCGYLDFMAHCVTLNCFECKSMICLNFFCFVIILLKLNYVGINEVIGFMREIQPMVLDLESFTHAIQCLLNSSDWLDLRVWKCSKSTEWSKLHAESKKMNSKTSSRNFIKSIFVAHGTGWFMMVRLNGWGKLNNQFGRSKKNPKCGGLLN